MKQKTKAHLWPEMHWSACGLVMLCIPVLAQILVHYGVTTPARAIGSTVIAEVFVIVLTWLHTRESDKAA